MVSCQDELKAIEQTKARQEQNEKAKMNPPTSKNDAVIVQADQKVPLKQQIKVKFSEGSSCENSGSQLNFAFMAVCLYVLHRLRKMRMLRMLYKNFCR